VPISYWQDEFYMNEDDPEDSGEYVPRRGPVDEYSPAEITDVPTSSTDVLRPRTLAAGYDSDREVLTVVFRDGTVWNYTGVTPGEWRGFSASLSKGKLLVKGSVLDGKSFGPASLTDLDPSIYAQISYISRLAQLKYRRKRRSRNAQGKLSYATDQGALKKAKRSGEIPIPNQPKSRAKNVYGKNTSTAGKASRPRGR